MCRASPSTTVSVTVTSGCRNVPDFSAYLRAYAHILSRLACEGLAVSAMAMSFQRRRALGAHAADAHRGPGRRRRGRAPCARSAQERQGLVDLLRVESGEPLVA